MVPCRQTWLAAGVALVLLAGCGGESAGVDRDDYESVFAAAMQAVADRDLEALWPLLTQNGRDGLERLLRTWQAQLRDPRQGSFILQQVRDRRGPVDPEELELARYGTLQDVWAFFLRADPRPARPPRRPARVFADGRAVAIDYEHPPGTLHAVRLVASPVGWYVDELQL